MLFSRLFYYLLGDTYDPGSGRVFYALSGIMLAEYVLQNVRFFNLFIVYRIEPISRPAIRLKYRLPA